MEIERKFLLAEGDKTFDSPYKANELKKEIISKGKQIEQHYISKKKLGQIKEIVQFEINFKPNQIRVRKYGEKCFLTIKSKGILAREEYEKEISKKTFEELKKLKKKTLKKMRLEKRRKDLVYEFDYFPKQKILTLEIEFPSIEEAKKFQKIGKEVTKLKKYGSKNLAN